MYLFLCPQLEMEVSRITVLIEQEVTTPTLQTFPVISLAMGKYSTKALYLSLKDWSSKVKLKTLDILIYVYVQCMTNSMYMYVCHFCHIMCVCSWGQVQRSFWKLPTTTSGLIPGSPFWNQSWTPRMSLSTCRGAWRPKWWDLSLISTICMPEVGICSLYLLSLSLLLYEPVFAGII